MSSPFKPFPCFLFQEQRRWSFREDRETALMRCLHHLRAASGEWSNIHVGLTATTPLFEEETYRKVCRMGRDAPFSAKMNQAHLHQGAILGHPAWHVLIALFLQVSSSLAPMQYTDVCRIAQLPNRGWLLGFGREVFFPRHKCSVERTENLMGSILLGYIYLYILLLHYIAICLYIYIDILLFFYCLIACLKHGSIAFFISIVLIRYSIFRNGPFFRLLIITGITVVAVFLSFIELSYYLFLISW